MKEIKCFMAYKALKVIFKAFYRKQNHLLAIIEIKPQLYLLHL